MFQTPQHFIFTCFGMVQVRIWGAGGSDPPSPQCPLSFETQDTLFLFSVAHC